MDDDVLLSDYLLEVEHLFAENQKRREFLENTDWLAEAAKESSK
jgi:hypothetical protein